MRDNGALRTLPSMRAWVWTRTHAKETTNKTPRLINTGN